VNIRVPHPVWFGVHKLIVSQRRRTGINQEAGEEGKSHKDVIQGIEVLGMADRMGHFDRITSAIESLTRKQIKLLKEAVDKHRDYVELHFPQFKDYFNTR